MSTSSTPPKIIFLGNGPLADAAKSVLESHCEIIFHAKTKDDLETVKSLKEQHPDAYAVLASFGVLIKSDLLDLFEPTGILNIHPSLLPKYRGPSPIETAILNGDTTFGVSVMKLASAMDAGPVYFQTEITNLPLDKSTIYQKLAEAGANWLVENLTNLPTPVAQDDSKATYTQKLTKSMGTIDPATETSTQIFRKIVAFQGFPKVRFSFYGQNCLILAAHPLDSGLTPIQKNTTLKTPPSASDSASPLFSTHQNQSRDSLRNEKDANPPLSITCADGKILVIDRLQPEGKRPMDAKSFLNGYARPRK